jgi:hypothetical protein
VKTEEMKSMAEKIMLNLKLEMLNPLLQVQMLFLFYEINEKTTER